MARTARQIAAQKKAALASARKRRGKRRTKARNKRINRKVTKVTNKTNRKIAKHRKTLQNNLYTNHTGAIYSNARGVKAVSKANRARYKGQKKVARLKSRRR